MTDTPKSRKRGHSPSVRSHESERRILAVRETIRELHEQASDEDDAPMERALMDVRMAVGAVGAVIGKGRHK